MILKGFKNFLGILVLVLLSTPLLSEEKINIWKEKKNEESLNPTNC